jgi:FixJ family two-component response regulator
MIRSSSRRHSNAESCSRCGNGAISKSVVDDDESVRESLPDLLREFGFEARAFSSAEEFLASDCVNRTKCLILDIGMPGDDRIRSPESIAGPKPEDSDRFYHRSDGWGLAGRAFEGGAVGFLLKPFSDTALLSLVEAALRTT